MRLPAPAPTPQNDANTEGGHEATGVSPRMGKEGWPFATADPSPDAGADPLHRA